MKTKWKVGDKVWWGNVHARDVHEMYVWQTVVTEVDGWSRKILYRLVIPERWIMKDAKKVYAGDLSNMKDEWEIREEELFPTKEKALNYVIDKVIDEIDRNKKLAAYLDDTILPRLQKQLNELQEQNNKEN